MPHIDELLGVATVAAAGLFVAVAIQPVASGTADDTAVPQSQASIAGVPSGPGAGRFVQLPAVEVVARRSVELARIEREERLAHQCVAKDAARPDA